MALAAVSQVRWHDDNGEVEARYSSAVVSEWSRGSDEEEGNGGGWWGLKRRATAGRVRVLSFVNTRAWQPSHWCLSSTTSAFMNDHVRARALPTIMHAITWQRLGCVSVRSCAKLVCIRSTEKYKNSLRAWRERETTDRLLCSVLDERRETRADPLWVAN